MNRINQLELYQGKEEAQFRVHFYIKNVYYSSDKRLQSFLEQTAFRISQTAPVNIIQIFGSIRRLVDLSIGLKSDTIASAFLQSGKKLYLPSQNKTLVEHEPIFSETFKIFHQHNKLTTANISQPPETKINKQNKPEIMPQILKASNASPQKHNDSESSQKSSEPITYTHSIYAFSVPLEFKEKDVLHALTPFKARIKYYEWKMRQDIEYLLIQTIDGVSETDISNTDVRIQRYPVLVASKSLEETINDVMLKHQVEVNFDKDIDEIEFMKTAARVGGVISLIKDDFYGPRKYVVAFCNLSKVNKFIQQLQLCFKGYRISKPKFPVRLCRLQRNFTFIHMIDNLSIYESQLKRAQSGWSGAESF